VILNTGALDPDEVNSFIRWTRRPEK
jgi:hypothetical protein